MPTLVRRRELQPVAIGVQVSRCAAPRRCESRSAQLRTLETAPNASKSAQPCSPNSHVTRRRTSAWLNSPVYEIDAFRRRSRRAPCSRSPDGSRRGSAVGVCRAVMKAMRRLESGDAQVAVLLGSADQPQICAQLPDLLQLVEWPDAETAIGRFADECSVGCAIEPRSARDRSRRACAQRLVSRFDALARERSARERAGAAIERASQGIDRAPIGSSVASAPVRCSRIQPMDAAAGPCQHPRRRARPGSGRPAGST